MNQCKAKTVEGLQCQLTKGHTGYHEAMRKILWGDPPKTRTVIRI